MSGIEEQKIYEGYIKGHSNKNKKVYTNPKTGIIKRIAENEEIPAGFIPGFAGYGPKNKTTRRKKCL